MKRVEELAKEMALALGLDPFEARNLLAMLRPTVELLLEEVERQLLDAARRYEPSEAEALVIGGGVAVDAVRALLRGETIAHDEQARAAVLARLTAAARAEEAAKRAAGIDAFADWVSESGAPYRHSVVRRLRDAAERVRLGEPVELRAVLEGR